MQLLLQYSADDENSTRSVEPFADNKDRAGPSTSGEGAMAGPSTSGEGAMAGPSTQINDDEDYVAIANAITRFGISCALPSRPFDGRYLRNIVPANTHAPRTVRFC